MACLVSVLITGIVIGRVSHGPDSTGQVFLENPPAVPTQSLLAEPRAGRSRAPLGLVVRPSETASHPVKPTPSRSHRPTRSPREKIFDPQTPVDARAEIGSQADTTGTGPRPVATLETQAVRLTNQARRRNGCRPLRVDPRLARSARQHSIEMAESGQLTNNSPDGSTPWKRMEGAGYPDGGAVNIGRGYPSAQEAVRGWMASPSHRANILNCRLAAIGIGVVEGPGGLWWTQYFGYS
ncbi:CAP domain-containing protein [Spongiactinospora sp. TRM90649]|uniref:CAP domain-containing protein n=1 Tax=Spongiactinospora sp. TRM90649 TaxID=3031114 RepID=UPI0023F6D4C9|nr:CAP domain-containing protein [Spongiactinospora sp. TRM90649]MDF5751496.1 CAP domain-containing protein [Spongiactinospora sp. TRM90649]